MHGGVIDCPAVGLYQMIWLDNDRINTIHITQQRMYTSCHLGLWLGHEAADCYDIVSLLRMVNDGRSIVLVNFVKHNVTHTK